MKKILFLHSSSELYGSDRSLLNLIKNMDRTIYKIIVILPEAGPLVEKLSEVDNVEIIVREIAVLRRKYFYLIGIIKYGLHFITSLIYLIRLISQKDIDLVYTNTSVVFPGGVAAKLMRKKSIWHIREIIENKLERKIVASIVNLFADIIIANSKATAKGISKNHKKIRVVYNAIERSPSITSIKPLNKDFIVIGMAGRINRWKGQKLFVDMAEMVLKKYKKVQFVIAGDVYKGETFILEDLKKYIKDKKIESKIKLLGQVSDMNLFYNNIDIFVLPSIKPEPFGLVILEAMERGIPVVATNHGGPTEIIENNIDGFLVDYTDATEMSEVVLKLVKDKELRKRIGKKGKEKRNKIFTIEKYVKDISKIISEV